MRAAANARIDLLMRVTGTSNAQLARALSFDASYISRIRTGKRGLPRERSFIEPAASFFARNVVNSLQADTLAREMGVPEGWPWPDLAPEDWLECDGKAFSRRIKAAGLTQVGISRTLGMSKTFVSEMRDKKKWPAAFAWLIYRATAIDLIEDGVCRRRVR